MSVPGRKTALFVAPRIQLWVVVLATTALSHFEYSLAAELTKPPNTALPPQALPLSWQDNGQVAAVNSGEPLTGLEIRRQDALLPESKSAADVFLHPHRHAHYQHLLSGKMQLHSGHVLISLPEGQVSTIHTPAADVQLSSSGEVLVSYDHQLLRVRNHTAGGHGVRVLLPSASLHVAGVDKHQGQAAVSQQLAFMLNPGFELVVGDHALSWAELCPMDGIARRKPVALDAGQIALSQYCMATALSSTDTCGLKKGDHEGKAKPVLDRLCKMAAAQYYVHGLKGYHFGVSQPVKHALARHHQGGRGAMMLSEDK